MNAGLLYLLLLLLYQLGRVRPGRREPAEPSQHAAQLLLLLHKVGLVPLLGEVDSGGHASDAPADHQRFLNHGGFVNL